MRAGEGLALLHSASKPDKTAEEPSSMDEPLETSAASPDTRRSPLDGLAGMIRKKERQV